MKADQFLKDVNAKGAFAPSRRPGIEPESIILLIGFSHVKLTVTKI